MMTPEDVSTPLPLTQHLERNIGEIFDVNFFISIILLQFAFILGIRIQIILRSTGCKFIFLRVVVQRPPTRLQ